jgi:hypothetical protein
MLGYERPSSPLPRAFFLMRVRYCLLALRYDCREIPALGPTRPRPWGCGFQGASLTPAQRQPPATQVNRGGVEMTYKRLAARISGTFRRDWVTAAVCRMRAMVAPLPLNTPVRRPCRATSKPLLPLFSLVACSDFQGTNEVRRPIAVATLQGPVDALGVEATISSFASKEQFVCNEALPGRHFPSDCGANR